MPKYSILFHSFPFLGQEHPDVGRWLRRAMIAAMKDPRIGEIWDDEEDDTPAPMVRNRCFLKAKELGADYLAIIDNDMKADAYLKGVTHGLGVNPAAKPFFETAFDFALERREKGELCVIAAPYCGPPPDEMPYIFRWTNRESGHASPDHALQMFTREEAAQRSGIEEVAALPTGLMLLDVRALERIEPLDLSSREVLEQHRAGEITTEKALQALEKGYCYYQWNDKYATQKATTEDVALTRDLRLAGVKQYCTWDCWAGHHKRKCVGKPQLLTADKVGERFRLALDRGQQSNEKLMIVRSANGVPAKEQHA